MDRTMYRSLICLIVLWNVVAGQGFPKCLIKSTLEEIDNAAYGGNDGFPQASVRSQCMTHCQDVLSMSYFGVARNTVNDSYARCYCGDELGAATSGGPCNYVCAGFPCGAPDAITVNPVCPEGFFGIGCIGNCTLTNCQYDVCHYVTGDCSDGCSDGYYSGYCNTTCWPDCLNLQCDQESGDCMSCGIGFCSNNCSQTCHHATCTLGCELDCGNCTGCATGIFGAICNETCSPNCVLPVCDQYTGSCTGCHPGYYGDSCRDSCPQNCNSSNPSCTQSDGFCMGGCKNGWWNSSCEASCSPNCNSDVPGCTQANGTCHGGCTPGWWALNCVSACPQNCKDAACGIYNGHCVHGCIPGWTDSDCLTDIDECLTAPCQNGGSCTNTLGSFTCQCQTGFHGLVCESDERPKIETIEPLFGPVAGKTSLNFTGDKLVHPAQVLLGNEICTIQNVSLPNSFTALTPQVDASYEGVTLPVTVTFSGGYQDDPDMTFTFKGDPEISSIHPLSTIAEGGTSLTIEGSNLDSVAQPILQVTMVIWQFTLINDTIVGVNETSTPYESHCDPPDADQVICYTPEMDVPPELLSNQTPSALKPHVSQLYKKDSTTRTEISGTFYIGLVLDGVPDFVNITAHPNLTEFGQIQVLGSPTFDKPPVTITFEKKGQIERIEGSDLRRVEKDNYEVEIGTERVSIIELFDNAITFLPPQKHPAHSQIHLAGRYDIIVHIGQNLQSESVGTIHYQANLPLILGVAFSLLVIIIVTITTGVVCKIRKRKAPSHENLRNQRIPLGTVPVTWGNDDNTGNPGNPSRRIPPTERSGENRQSDGSGADSGYGATQFEDDDVNGGQNIPSQDADQTHVKELTPAMDQNTQPKTIAGAKPHVNNNQYVRSLTNIQPPLPQQGRDKKTKSFMEQFISELINKMKSPKQNKNDLSTEVHLEHDTDVLSPQPVNRDSYLTPKATPDYMNITGHDAAEALQQRRSPPKRPVPAPKPSKETIGHQGPWAGTSNKQETNNQQQAFGQPMYVISNGQPMYENCVRESTLPDPDYDSEENTYENIEKHSNPKGILRNPPRTQSNISNRSTLYPPEEDKRTSFA